MTDRVTCVTLHSYVEVFQNDWNMVLLALIDHSFCVNSSDKINSIRVFWAILKYNDADKPMPIMSHSAGLFHRSQNSKILTRKIFIDISLIFCLSCLSVCIEIFLMEENNIIISVWIVIPTQILVSVILLTEVFFADYRSRSRSRSYTLISWDWATVTFFLAGRGKRNYLLPRENFKLPYVPNRAH